MWMKLMLTNELKLININVINYSRFWYDTAALMDNNWNENWNANLRQPFSAWCLPKV